MLRPPPVPSPRTPWQLLALIALPPALIAVIQLGRMHPDEVYQFLEPAQCVAFGGKPLAWEWDKGLRNWAIPGALGWTLKLAAALGVADPQLRRAALELPQYALHVAMLAALYRLVRRQLNAVLPGDTRVSWLALAGVALVGWHGPVLHFAGRTMSESFSAAFLLWGLERADARDVRPRAHRLAGLLLGMAVVARYGSAVIVACALIVLAAQRRWRALADVALGGAAVALLLGALDYASWGKPFHSLFAYLDFNLSAKAAQTYGREPWGFYLAPLAIGVAPWAAIALLHALRYGRSRPAWWPSPLFLFGALGYLVVLALTEHKEVRFLYPAIVLLCACLLPAWLVLALELARRIARGRAALERTALASLLALSLASGWFVLTQPTRFEPHGQEQFQLFVHAVRGGHGVVLLHCGQWGAPGPFYAAGRPNVLCGDPNDRCTRDALHERTFDRIVGWEDEGRERFTRVGFAPIERRGSAVLWAR